MKELVAKFVLYLLTLNLMTDITAVFLMEKSPCEANDEDQDQGQGQGQAQAEDPKNNNNNNGNKTVYKTTE